MGNSLADLFIVGPNGTLPSFSTSGSACFDIYASSDVVLSAQIPTLVPTDLKLSDKANDLRSFYLAILPRSGNSLKGIKVLNSPGTVDTDYKGEIKIISSFNAGKTLNSIYQIRKGDRVAQGMFVKLSELQQGLRIQSNIDRDRHGGFGSTGD